MTDLSVTLALLAGVVSFASPCFLPVVPVFVGSVVGVGPDGAPPRRAALANALWFVLGFGSVFVALWASVGLLGYAVGGYRPVLRVAGGAVLVVMGLHVAGLVRVPVLDRQWRPLSNGSRSGATGSAGVRPSGRRAALLGVAFGAGWTPCIGPVLGAVIGLAATGDDVARGTGLLVAYTLGLGVPFVLVAVGADAVGRRLGWLRRHHLAVSLTGGALLVGTGFALLSGVYGRLSALVPGFVI